VINHSKLDTDTLTKITQNQKWWTNEFNDR